MEKQKQSLNAKESTTPTPQTESRLRLEYLDGLRGLAALYVVFHHAYLQSTSSADRFNLRTPLNRALHFLDYGHFAVAIFIVLSGYCLMIPLAKTRTEPLRGGFIGYIWRRAKRILPPYYAVIGFTFLLMILEPRLTQRMDVYWDLVLPLPGTEFRGGVIPNILREVELPAYTNGTVLSHLFLVQNWVKGWIYQIGYPLWSVATEWQIYFLFPLLLWIRRRAGNVMMAAAAVLLGAMTRLIPGHPGEQGSVWFIGAFGLGMLGAAVSFSTEDTVKRFRERLPWGVISGVLFGLFLLMGLINSRLLEDWNTFWIIDTYLGVAVMCLLIACTRSIQSGRMHLNLPLRLFDLRPSVFLGKFSYSLYLVHAPILAWLHLHVRVRTYSETVACLWMFGLGVPLCILASYLFYLLCERPFVSQTAKSKVQKVKPADETASSQVAPIEPYLTPRPSEK